MSIDAQRSDHKALLELADTLETERLLLERWGERGREPWRAIVRDPEMMRYIGSGEVWTMERADAAFDRALAHWRDYGFGRRAVLTKHGADWLGFVTLTHVGPGAIEVPSDEVEIGWWISRRAWGNGYALEAASAARDEAFASVGLERIIARVQPTNEPSVRVAEKLGMSLEREATGRHGEPVRIYELIQQRNVTALLNGRCGAR